MDAIICEHCGKSIKSVSQINPTNKDVEWATKYLSKELEAKIEKVSKKTPAEGVAIYMLDQNQPIEIRLENEFFIGRITEETEDKVVDLTPYNGLDLGVSRRHLMIRRVGKGYKAIDLYSTNGTWVNKVCLVPQRPFPLDNESQIQLGKMRIFIVYHE
jgi:pSer/pThr/pTyr-binding forkhead associated (FHA) protein